MTSDLHTLEGGCRCGSVRFAYRCSEPLSAQTGRRCQCEFCLPRGASYLSDPAGKLEVRVKDARYLYAHRFGTGTADFMHCAICNSEVFVASEIDSVVYALVCVPALDQHEQLAAFCEVSHDGESLQQRLDRRARSWIPVLHVVTEHENR